LVVLRSLPRIINTLYNYDLCRELLPNKRPGNILTIKVIESKLAEKRKAETLPQKGTKGFQSNDRENLPPHTNKGKARDKAAAKVGWSGRKYYFAVLLKDTSTY